MPAMASMVVVLGLSSGLSLKVRASGSPGPILAAKVASALGVVALGIPLTLRFGLLGAAWGQVACAGTEGIVLSAAILARRRK